MRSAVSRTLELQEAVLAIDMAHASPIAAVHLLSGEAVLLNLDTGQEQRLSIHPTGAPLSTCVDADGEGFLSAGDDGRLVRFSWHDAPEELARHNGKWLDHVASSATGAYRAYSAGKEVFILGRSAPLTQPSTVGGLAFSPNGKRLAVSHYNGVSLYWTSAKKPAPQTLLWKGSHLKTLWHPAGDYLMTSMQEPALHGWRMKDLHELRMAGYPARVQSFGFSANGKWLATSGADQLICWPFAGSGPQGKPPMALGIPEGYPCTVVAPHPRDELLAAGFASGRVVLALYEDRLPIEILPPDGTPITAAAWSANGSHLLTARENGTLHVYTNESIIASTG